MPVPIFPGVVNQHGVIDFANRSALKDWVRTLIGKPVDVVIRRARAQRSHNQNRYYWGVLIATTAEFCGYDPDEMHTAWKWECLRQHEDGKPDRVRSTTDLTTAEFEAYQEQIRRKAAEMGCYVPLPNEVAV